MTYGEIVIDLLTLEIAAGVLFIVLAAVVARFAVKEFKKYGKQLLDA